MYSCGASIIANFFPSQRSQSSLTKLDCFKQSIVAKVCIQKKVAIILLHDGSVHTFGNENQLLGHTVGNSKVTSLETIKVSDVNVGDGHFFAIDNSGKVFGWGHNEYGQLGWKETNSYTTPKLVKPLSAHKINMVACGDVHTIFLGCNGSIWAAGHNNFGQLGTGHMHDCPEIKLLESLRGIPFQQVAAGSSHSLALTVSGTIFVWGRNDSGQLGLGDLVNRTAPTLLKLLRTQDIKFVCAGESHTVALTASGRVFTFGLNSSGQLGHGNPLAEGKPPYFVSPQQVFELMGDVVTHVCCGSFHTLTFVAGSGQIYGFGSNRHGQLGLSKSGNMDEFLPHRLIGPWAISKALPTTVSSSASTFYDAAEELPVYVNGISAGGNESIILTSSSEISKDFQTRSQRNQLCTVSRDFLLKLERIGSDSRLPLDLKQHLEMVMSSPACLNGSFLNTDHAKTNSHYHGVDLMLVRLAFSKLNDAPCKDVKNLMAYSIQKQLSQSPFENPPDVEALRLYLWFPECFLFNTPEYFSDISIPFARKCNKLSGAASKVLNKWYGTLEPIYFKRQVDIYLNSVTHLLRKKLHYDKESQNYLQSALDFLKNLNFVNSSGPRSVIPYQRFYLSDISRLINLEEDYVQWYSQNRRSVTFCSYPFLFNSTAKSSLLQIDASWQMRAAYQQAQERNMISLLGISSSLMERAVLELEVRRHELVHDALNKLANVDMASLKKPLVVKFFGEDGQDAGGVRKEFFMLILKEVIDPKYGMFRYYEDSRLIWFSDYELETESMYFLIGIVCGLAIYNNTIIDLCFPLALYKKLLGEKVFLSDLIELDPTVGKNMQLLLEYNECDQGCIEDVFCLNFTINMDYFGEVRTFDLKPGGSDISVTKDNRQEYVDRYLDHIFNKSVQKQFDAFYRGFHKVCGGNILQLFRPMELMEMVVGNQNYNWEDFEAQAVYKGEYYRNHPTIAIFWEVFHHFNLEEKKEFLLFLTGCNKIPINGVKIVIQPLKLSEKYLPVAHTCFNTLDLPIYNTKQRLKEKLLQAMSNNQGFHLA